ncbi:MAG TPA: hypothetical protein VG818_13370 [Gemmatimonadaceae bacterium]|nr:hypothetical protein [Gemmatimonadaceae bacterium]
MSLSVLWFVRHFELESLLPPAAVLERVARRIDEASVLDATPGRLAFSGRVDANGFALEYRGRNRAQSFRPIIEAAVRPDGAGSVVVGRMRPGSGTARYLLLWGVSSAGLGVAVYRDPVARGQLSSWILYAGTPLLVGLVSAIGMFAYETRLITRWLAAFLVAPVAELD